MRATLLPGTTPADRAASVRRLVALAFVVTGCGENVPAPAPEPAPSAAPTVAPAPPVEPPGAPTPEPAIDPGHPTMGATRAEATPLFGTETPRARVLGATLVPQIVHRSAPESAVSSGERVVVSSGRRTAIVERATGAVRAWSERFPEDGHPRAVDFAPDGSFLIVRPTRYADPYEHEIVVVGPDGERPDGERHTYSLPGYASAAFVEGGVATADRELHLHAPDLESERTIELDWTNPATRMVVSPDRRLVAVENEAGDVRVVHVVRGAIVARLHAEPWAPLAALRAEEAAAREAAEPDGEEAEGAEPPPDDPAEEPSPITPSAHRAWVALAFSADGHRFAAVRGDGLARVLDLTTSHALGSIEPAVGAGATDVTRAGLSADGSVLVLAGARGGTFSAETGEPLPSADPLDADLVPPAPFDPAPFLATPIGGEYSMWYAAPIPGMEAFLLAGRFGATVLGPDTVREIDCLDGEAPIRFEEWPALAIQDRGTCDLRTNDGPVFSLEERGGGYDATGGDENDDGTYDEVEEEPEVSVVRGQLAVLGARGRRTRVPGTEGISEDDVRIVELTGARLLVADDGVSTRIFRIERPAGLVATLGAGHVPHRATPAALLVTSPTHWRALGPDGTELAAIALDEGHAGATPTPCTSPDGATIAVGIGATLHVLDAAWHETATLAMPAADGACVHGDRVLVERSPGVVEVWSLTDARRTAVWAVSSSAVVSVRLGLALADRDILDTAADTPASALDLIDLREGRVIRTFGETVEDGGHERTLSDDGRFVAWAVNVHARVVRLSDGASIRLGRVTAGEELHLYAVADDGVFSTSDPSSVGLFRVREAGPAGSAPLLDEAATRARFYRPTLFDDFFHDRPLPTPGGSGSDAAVRPE